MSLPLNCYLTNSFFASQGPVIYAQLDHSGSKNSFHKMEPVVYADIRKNWRRRRAGDQEQLQKKDNKNTVKYQTSTSCSREGVGIFQLGHKWVRFIVFLSPLFVFWIAWCHD